MTSLRKLYESREGTGRAKVRKERIQAQSTASTEVLSQKMPGMFEEQKGGSLFGRSEWEGVCKSGGRSGRAS